MSLFEDILARLHTIAGTIDHAHTWIANAINLLEQARNLFGDTTRGSTNPYPPAALQAFQAALEAATESHTTLSHGKHTLTGYTGSIGQAGTGKTSHKKQAGKQQKKDPAPKNERNRPKGNQGAGLEIPPGEKKNKWLHERASQLGFTRRISPVGFGRDTHGQPVFENPKTRMYISPDATGHNLLNGWKLFNRKKRRIATCDPDLNPIKE
ncbi:hypothetical protein [Actinokineospora sp. NPDC004072]